MEEKKFLHEGLNFLLDEIELLENKLNEIKVRIKRLRNLEIKSILMETR